MTPVCMSGAGVADPNDNRDELNLAVAGALECSWFVGFATSPSAFVGHGGGLCVM